MASVRPLLRDLTLGVGVLVLHYVIDALESWAHVQQALRRVQATSDGNDALRTSVMIYIAGTFGAYVVIGLFAGVLLHAWQRLVQPRRPVVSGFLFLASIAVLANIRLMIHQPGMHDWFLYRPLVASWVPPVVPAAFIVLILAGSLYVGWRRAAASRDFGLRAGLLLSLAALPFVLWYTPEPERPQPNGGPNVLFISFDALRPDHLGFYGAERKITPNLDRFLEEATVWDEAYTPMARTWPAWVATLTGTFPYTNGERDPLPAPDRIIPPVPTLPQVLQTKGWTTAFRTDDSRFSYMVPGMGFDRIEQPYVGIANFAISGSEPRFRAFYGLLDNPLGWFFVPVVRENQAFGRSYRNTRFNRDSRQTIAELSKKDRFFMAIHDCTLHAPADRYYPYDMLFDQRNYKGDNRFRYLSLGSVTVSDALPEDEERIAAAQNLNLYDAGVVTIDRTFALLRQQLEDGGLWDNSIVVLMSDHGEDFYEEGQRYRFNGPNHGFHVWGQGQHRVVLAIHWPSALRDRYPVGVRHNLASLVDLTPTIAEALGFEWHGDGRSLFSDTPRVLYTETGLSESFYFPTGHRQYPFKNSATAYDIDPETTRVYARPELRDAILHVKDRFVMDEQYKLVWYAMEEGLYLELFDWREDPLNHHDVAAQHPDVVASLWPYLVERLRADGEVVPDDPTGARPLPPRVHTKKGRGAPAADVSPMPAVPGAPAAPEPASGTPRMRAAPTVVPATTQ